MVATINNGFIHIRGNGTDKPNLGDMIHATDSLREYHVTVVEGTAFLEIDTGDFYIMDKDGDWVLQPAGGSPRY